MAKKTARTPMAVDKSNTPAWMRVVVIALAITFGLGGVAVVAAGIGGSTTPATGTASNGDSITAQFQPRVDAALAAMETNPENPDIVIQVGHAYFEWAVALYESGQYQGSVPMWLAAVSYYDQTLALDPGNDIALGNKAFALYYAQDEGAPAGLQAFIDGAADNTDLAQQVENARGMLADLEASSTTTTTP